MTSRTSKLVLAAVLIGSVPALAAARDPEHDCDRDHEGPARPVVVVAPVHAPLPPVYAPAPPAPPAYERWQERRSREDGWRHRELEMVRGELATLEAQRAEFHAQNAWRPGKLRKFDRWYFERRTALERREQELLRVAWR